MTADEIYTILVTHAGAREDDRGIFKHALSNHDPRYPFKWRFVGELGFGGKFWHSHGRRYISCYFEDETEERRNIIEKVNKLLDSAHSEV